MAWGVSYTLVVANTSGKDGIVSVKRQVSLDSSHKELSLRNGDAREPTKTAQKRTAVCA